MAEAPRGSNLRDVHLVAVAEQARSIRLSAQRLESIVVLLPPGTDIMKEIPVTLGKMRKELLNIQHNINALIARIGTGLPDE
jgi:hypothetical protein